MEIAKKIEQISQENKKRKLKTKARQQEEKMNSECKGNVMKCNVKG